MLTIATIDGLRVVIYTADHRQAHVHVIGSGFEVVFNLHRPKGPPEVRTIAGKVSDAGIRQIFRMIEPEVAAFCAAWRKHHGNF